MSHERDEKYEGQEDSEYQFSDDQISYDTDTTDVKTAGGKYKADIVGKILYYKRPLIGVGVFFILIFLVYKIVTPNAATPPSTEFNQAATTTTEAKPATTASAPIAEHPNVKLAASAEPQPAVAAPQPSLAPTPQPQVTMPATSAQPQAMPQQQAMTPPPASMQQTIPAAQPQPTMPAPVAQNIPPQSQPEMPASQNMMPSPAQQQAMPAQGQMPAAPTSTMPTEAPQPSTAGMSLLDRMTVLETQSAKTQTELMQKISEQQAEASALQNKMQDLTMRMASLENTLIRLGRIIHETKGGKAMEEVMTGEPVRVVAKPAPAPHVTYSVQAIIPGRAWLKSESGDTVTVAEGDVVKDLGRVVKIDPYDGVVQVDSSGRMVSLSYGAANSE